MRPDLSEETPLWSRGGVIVFGVDEVGRGCLAGPICAAVACWSPCAVPPIGLRDSKQMSEAQREACFDPLRSQALAFGVGFGSRLEIDRWNILRANYLAVARALEAALQRLGDSLPGASIAFLTDGNQPLVSRARFFADLAEYGSELPLVRRLFQRGFEEKCVVKGDAKVFSIASASVLAKVSRDRLMVEMDACFPQYGFAAHKGYSTAQHVAALRRAGPCPEHRRSFAPVAESLELFPEA